MEFMITTWQQTKGIDTNAVLNLCPKGKLFISLFRKYELFLTLSVAVGPKGDHLPSSFI